MLVLTDIHKVSPYTNYQLSIIHFPFVATQHPILSRIGEKRVLKARPKVVFCREFSREFEIFDYHFSSKLSPLTLQNTLFGDRNPKAVFQELPDIDVISDGGSCPPMMLLI